MKFIKCADCTLLNKCPSGQICVKLIKDFARYCPVGKTRGEKMYDRRFSDDGFVYDDNNTYVSPLDDDYEFWKSEQTDPLSDDYCKYDNE